MITFREIRMIARAVARKIITEEVRTHIPGQVVSYDPATNTAEIQPVVRKLRTLDPDNMTTIDWPVLGDVPVQQLGSGTLWCTVAPAVGSYGTLHVYDREIDTWLTSAGVVDPQKIRLHNPDDSLFVPGLLPLVVEGDNGVIEEPVKTDRIELRTRTGITAIAVLDDETIEIKNEKCTAVIDIDGNVTITADGAITATAGDTITLDNGSETLAVDGAEVKAGTGTDFVAMAVKTQANFDLLNTIISAWVPVATDGGAALKTAWSAAWPAAVQQVKSSNLKAD